MSAVEKATVLASVETVAGHKRQALVELGVQILLNLTPSLGNSLEWVSP